MKKTVWFKHKVGTKKGSRPVSVHEDIKQYYGSQIEKDRTSRYVRYLKYYEDKYSSEDGRPDNNDNIGDLTDYDLQELTPGQNLIRILVNTYHSMITSAIPRAAVLPRDTTFSTHRQAKGLDRFLLEQAKYLKFKRLAHKIVKDGCLFGFGVFYPYICERSKEIKLEAPFPGEFIIDEKSTYPRQDFYQIFRRHVVSRDELAAKYADDPVAVAAIMDEPPAFGSEFSADLGQDSILVTEAFKREYTKGDGTGRYAVCLSDVTLKYEKWGHKFPFVFFKVLEPVVGWYPPSLVKYHIDEQIKLNDTELAIHRITELTANVVLMTQTGSQISNEKTLTDPAVGEFKILHVDGPEMPKVLQPPPLPSELFGYRDRAVPQMLEQEGLTSFTAGAQLPESFRADSSKAVREMHAISSRRHKEILDRFEDACLDTYKRIAELSADLHKKFEGLNRKHTYKLGSRVYQIDWKSLDFDADRFHLTVGASSDLNDTAASIEDNIATLATAGVLSPSEYVYALQNKDLDHVLSRKLAGLNQAKFVSEILEDEDKEFPTPHPRMDLETAKFIVNQEYLNLNLHTEVPEGVFSRFEQWMDLADDTIAKIKQAEQQALIDASQAAQAGQSVGLNTQTPNPTQQ